MDNIILNKKLDSLIKSKFRSSFHLKEKDILYVNNKGYERIESNAYDFVKNRLAPEVINNDGKQTPMRGHPVFIAQHATATCCRECLYKWHHIEKFRKLTKDEIDYIVKLIMTWIIEDINR